MDALWTKASKIDMVSEDVGGQTRAAQPSTQQSTAGVQQTQVAGPKAPAVKAIPKSKAEAASPAPVPAATPPKSESPPANTASAAAVAGVAETKGEKGVGQTTVDAVKQEDVSKDNAAPPSARLACILASEAFGVRQAL